MRGCLRSSWPQYSLRPCPIQRSAPSRASSSPPSTAERKSRSASLCPLTCPRAVFDARAPTDGLRSSGSSSSRAAQVAAIRKYIDTLAADNAFSGVVLVAHGDKILLHIARGLADREKAIPITLDTKFHLASVGKMFTAASIAQLVNAGKLRFDDK